jgi:hypothetical protein
MKALGIAKMDQTFVFATRTGSEESYQLLAGRAYCSTDYNHSVERDKFYEALGNVFAKRIIAQKAPQAVHFVNGAWFNPETAKLESRQAIEEQHADQLKSIIARHITAECGELEKAAVILMN